MASKGVGFGCFGGSTGTILAVATVIFIILKVTGTITWSWWAVLAPIWVPIAFVLFGALMAAAGALCIAGIFLVIALIVAIFE